MGFEYMVEKKAQDGGFPQSAVVRHHDFLFYWMAPELITGEAPTKLSDLYSLCTVLWELLHGCLPWTRQGLTIDSSRLNDTCLVTLLEDGLQQFPGCRSMSVTEMRLKLRRIIVDKGRG